MTTDTTPRCRNTLARKRDSPLTPNEKCSSLVVSKRLRCSSESRLYARFAVASGDRTSCTVGSIDPSMRYIGGTPAVRCRSDARLGIISSSSVRRVTTVVHFLSFGPDRTFARPAPACGPPRSPGGPRSQLVRGGLLEHFFHRCNATLELLERVTPQRQHALLDGELLDLPGRGAVQHQITHLRGDRQHLVHALAAAVAGVVALDATRAFDERGLLGFGLVDLELAQHLVVELDRTLARVAHPTHQPLSQHQLNRRSHQE